MNGTLRKLFGIKGITQRLWSAPGVTISLAVAAAVFAAVNQGPYIIVNTVVTGSMWALMSMGLALVFGVMNIPSFAHGEYFMIGGLTAYFTFNPFVNFILHNPNSFIAAVAPLLGLAAATLAGAVAGILTEFLVFRPLRRRTREQWIMNSFVITVGLSVLLINSHLVLFGAAPKGVVKYWYYPDLVFMNVNISIDRFFVFLLSILVMFSFWLFMTFTQAGRAIRAVSQDEAGALMVGVDLDGIQALTIAVSCALAGLAGGCLLFLFPAYPTSGLVPLYNSWFVVVVVGLGNVSAAAIGGFIVALLQSLSSAYVGEGWGLVIPSIVIVIILIVKPSGLFGSPIRSILEQ